KKQIDGGATPGPKMHVTGPYLEGKGTFALQLHQLSGPDDAIRTVNYWLDEGVDNFKAYNFITPDELSAAIKAAHKRGAKTTGHLCSIGFREAASRKPIEHRCPVVFAPRLRLMISSTASLSTPNFS